MGKTKLFYKRALVFALTTANAFSFAPEAAKASIMPNRQYLYFSEEKDEKFEKKPEVGLTNTMQQDEIYVAEALQQQEEASNVSELNSEDTYERFMELVINASAESDELFESMQDLENALEEYQSKKFVESGDIFEELASTDEYNWNFDMLSGFQSANFAAQPSTEPVKVAIIDSGVNFSCDINVEERKDFIDGRSENDIAILYEDFSGHGTNIAGVIAAQENDIGVTGGNPNVLLYSARVLDAANEAPISRVVEAIDWAISREVHIINLSFTTATDSPELKAAIQRAYDAGILLIAAAGNEGYVAYPAAYPEVIAVGAINSQGELCSFSPLQGSVELLAPGELITSTDVFDTMSTHSGTSYAAPHVTAIASKLWERDLSMSANYVRCVLDISANLWKNDSRYGYGLVDYNFGCIVFDALKPYAKYCDDFATLMKLAIEICNIHNPNRIPTTELPKDIVEGAWYLNNEGEYEHMALLDELYVKNDNGRAIIMAGCIMSDWDDPKLDNMYVNPYFHGYAFYNEYGDGTAVNDHEKYIPANYIAGTLYLSRIARAMVRGNVYTTASAFVTIKQNGSTIYALNNIIDDTYLHKNDVTWAEVENMIGNISASKSGGRTDKLNFNANDPIHKGLFIYGLTLHSIADIFVHSTAEDLDNDKVWKLIHHDKADDVNYISERNKAAQIVCQRALRNFSVMSDSSSTSSTNYSSYDCLDISIFDLSDYSFENKFRLINFDLYAREVCKSSALFKPTNEKYYTNSNFWNKMDAGIFKNTRITSGKPYFNPDTKQFQNSSPGKE